VIEPEKSYTIELPTTLSASGAVSYTPCFVEVDYFAGLNAEGYINGREGKLKNAFGPAGRSFDFNFHETVTDPALSEVCPEEDALEIMQTYKNQGDYWEKNMYIFLTKELYNWEGDEKKKQAGYTFRVPGFEKWHGILLADYAPTRTFIHEFGHHITAGILQDDPEDHLYRDNKTWDSGCVIPNPKGVGENTFFDQSNNPHFCHKCMGIITSNLVYPKE